MVQEVNIVDLSRIESRLIRENYVFGLGFPQSSGQTEWVVLRAVAVGKINTWLYDPIQEGQLTGPIAAANSFDGITGHTYIEPTRPSSKYIQNQSYAPFVFAVTPTRAKFGNLYQLFFGISPYFLRVLFNQPSTQPQMGLPIQNPTPQYNQFGAIRAEDTPLYNPGPISEIMVPPGLDFAIGYVNDVNYPASPLIMWIINYLRYEIITDPDVVYEVIHTTKYKSLRTVGGITSYGYSVKDYFGISPVTLGMTKAQIANAVGGI